MKKLLGLLGCIALIAALLVPSMVFAAEQDQSDVSVTTEVTEAIVCIDVTPTEYDFGTVKEGECEVFEDAFTITLCQENNVDIEVTATASGDDATFYEDCLYILDGETYVHMTQWAISIADDSEPVVLTVRICIPYGDYSGSQTATLSFVAEVEE